jgi:pyruvate/2-oxoglutarate dehydrogenase complex dihydrolipoamide dehydrogenase (E3) component
MTEAAPLKVLVIGGGPAGASAALQARELGADVTLLEADQVGGTSLNRGPAPVRTLARAARLARDWSSWEQFGLRGPRPTLDLDAVLANSTRVARHAHDIMHAADRIRDLGIDLVDHLGAVGFTDPRSLRARDGRSWQGDRIILAVGGRAAPLPVRGGQLALTYNDLRSLKTLPGDVMVVGGSDTGCQIASILQDFGVTVRLLEFAATLLPAADPSISAMLRSAFQAQGMVVSTDTRVTELEAVEDRIAVHFVRGGESGQVEVGAVFAAVGWPGNFDGLALEAAGIDHDLAAIPVDDYMRTNVKDIFAVGDANGRSKLVQTARLEGRAAAWNAVRGPSRQPAYDVVPSASFTDPEYGAVGLTEPEAARGYDVAVGIARYDDLLRPVADGHSDGFCKLIADRSSHLILGAHVVGEYSAETVQVVATAMSARMTVDQLADMQFAFPTYTEAVSAAAQKICRVIGAGNFPPAWSTHPGEQPELPAT